MQNDYRKVKYICQMISEISWLRDNNNSSDIPACNTTYVWRVL